MKHTPGLWRHVVDLPLLRWRLMILVLSILRNQMLTISFNHSVKSNILLSTGLAQVTLA